MAPLSRSEEHRVRGTLIKASLACGALIALYTLMLGVVVAHWFGAFGDEPLIGSSGSTTATEPEIDTYNRSAPLEGTTRSAIARACHYPVPVDLVFVAHDQYAASELWTFRALASTGYSYGYPSVWISAAGLWVYC